MLERAFERAATTEHFELKRRTTRATPDLCAAIGPPAPRAGR
jgi:hypothetical protein